MLRWLLVLVLAVASATAWAQSALTDATTRAWNTAAAAEQTLARATAKSAEVDARFQTEKDEVSRLKNAPRSWRRDRDVRAKMSDADATGIQATAARTEVRNAAAALATARRALILAIDAELAANPSAPRKAQLDKARAMVAPASNAHRIVLPDMKIDPLADPEELDQQATAIRDTEVQLDNQIKGLESQAKELDRVAMLRKQSERAKEMDQRDDNSARKGSTPTGSRGAGETAAAPTSTDSGNPSPGGALSGGSFESDAKITLADVIDPNTLDALDRAQRSNDPTKRAAAARLTKEAVAKRLAQLRDKRKQVEDRAAQLRKK